MIIDETPSAVMLSSFDGVRREIARITLERMIADGRINPALVEESYELAKVEIDERIVERGRAGDIGGARGRRSIQSWSHCSGSFSSEPATVRTSSIT